MPSRLSQVRKAVHPRFTAHRRSPARMRFYAKAEIDWVTECWNWTGYTQANGYGVIGENNRIYYVHRWAYEHFVGPIPDGLHIDHTCRNRRCVNWRHLEPVTQAENNRRAWAAVAARTHCHRGHVRAEHGGIANGKFYCRACHREDCKRFRDKRRGAA